MMQDTQLKFPANLPAENPSEAWEKLNTQITTCRACSRLVEWREKVAREKRRAYRDWYYWGKPVPGFGDPHARLFVVGLAPGAHGSNRTGRMFTGDSSGDTLFGALYRTGFANQPTAQSRDDSLLLRDVFITAIGRCAPPQNKPTRIELNTCEPFLLQEWHLMPQATVLLALGKMAFDGILRMLRADGIAVPRMKFGHAFHTEIPTPTRTLHLLASYHPSRQNTQTGRLTQAMFDDIFVQARAIIDG